MDILREEGGRVTWRGAEENDGERVVGLRSRCFGVLMFVCATGATETHGAGRGPNGSRKRPAPVTQASRMDTFWDRLR